MAAERVCARRGGPTELENVECPNVYSWILDLADVVADRSPEELIGAILFAMTLAGISAVVCRLFARRVADPMTVSVAVILVGNVVSLLTGSLYIVHKAKISRIGAVSSHTYAQSQIQTGKSRRQIPHGGYGGAWAFRGDRVWAAFDRDHDGRLSSGEIDAIAVILKKWDTDHDGAVSPREWWQPHPDRERRESSHEAKPSVDRPDHASVTVIEPTIRSQ
jgi:hypothetical protein